MRCGWPPVTMLGKNAQNITTWAKMATGDEDDNDDGAENDGDDVDGNGNGNRNDDDDDDDDSVFGLSAGTSRRRLLHIHN